MIGALKRACAPALLLLAVEQAAAQTLASAVLPVSRSVAVGSTATAYATVINTGSVLGTGCTIAPATAVPANFFYQQTNSATNALIGSPNTPVDIPAGGFRTFAIGFTPTGSFPATDVGLTFKCTNTSAAALISGVNTLLLSASAGGSPDVISIAATPSNDGLVYMTSLTGLKFFAVSGVNIGTPADLTVTANVLGGAEVAANLCETNPATGACLAAPAASVTSNFAAGVARTFAVFLAGQGQLIAPDFAAKRVRLEFREAGGALRGATGIAVCSILKSGCGGAGDMKIPSYAETIIRPPQGVIQSPSDMGVIDFDGDGDLDLVASQVFNPPTFPATEMPLLAFRNNNGTFVDATVAVFNGAKTPNVRRFRPADFNNDGRPDLFVADHGTDTDPYPGAQSRLFMGTADGRLVDETTTRLPARIDYTHSAAVGDLDNNGGLDIFMGNYGPSRVYLGTPAGVLTEQNNLLPTNYTNGLQQPNSSAFCDVNRDGKLDLLTGGIYYSPDGQPDPTRSRDNMLLLGDGTGKLAPDPAFTLPPKLYGFQTVIPEVVCGDLNADGAPDILFSSDIGAQTPGLQLLLNDGTGRFRDATANLNLTFPPADRWVVSIYINDMNNDGTPDLVLRMNSGNNNDNSNSASLLLNRGNGVFYDASASFTANSAGMAVGDFDRDGVKDIVTLLHNYIRLFKGGLPQ